MSYLPTVNEQFPSVDELPGNGKKPFPSEKKMGLPAVKTLPRVKELILRVNELPHYSE